MLLAIVLTLAIMTLFASLPKWPHTRKLQYYPSGGISLVLFLLLIVCVIGRL